MATTVYIDGFNFYHGCIRDTRYHWLDFEQFAKALLPKEEVVCIKYFTARVTDRPDDPHQSQRQDTYLRALGTLGTVKIYEGNFRTRKKRVRLVRPRVDGSLFDYALVTEEKGTDVALGAHLVWDAAHGLLTQALVVSNDSDLQVPVDMAMELGIYVIVANPHRHAGQAPHLHGNERRNIRRTHLEGSQLPRVVLADDGRQIVRPSRWDP